MIYSLFLLLSIASSTSYELRGTRSLRDVTTANGAKINVLDFKSVADADIPGFLGDSRSSELLLKAAVNTASKFESSKKGKLERPNNNFGIAPKTNVVTTQSTPVKLENLNINVDDFDDAFDDINFVGMDDLSPADTDDVVLDDDGFDDADVIHFGTDDDGFDDAGILDDDGFDDVSFVGIDDVSSAGTNDMLDDDGVADDFEDVTGDDFSVDVFDDIDNDGTDENSSLTLGASSFDDFSGDDGFVFDDVGAMDDGFDDARFDLGDDNVNSGVDSSIISRAIVAARSRIRTIFTSLFARRA